MYIIKYIIGRFTMVIKKESKLRKTKQGVYLVTLSPVEVMHLEAENGEILERIFLDDHTILIRKKR